MELVEGALQHVLRVDLLNSQQVQHHVVGEVERTVQRVCTTLGVYICVCVGWRGRGRGRGGLYICAMVVVYVLWTCTCVTMKMHTCRYVCTCCVVHAVYITHIHTYTMCTYGVCNTCNRDMWLHRRTLRSPFPTVESILSSTMSITMPLSSRPRLPARPLI